jgi:16S rRNA processing protein RimM
VTTPPSHAAWIWLARIRRPQGRKGEVFADILTDFPQKFAERRRLWLIAAEPEEPAAMSPEQGPGLRKPGSLVSGHDFSHAGKANKMGWASQAAGEPGSHRPCNKGTTLFGPQQADSKDTGFSPCLAEPPTERPTLGFSAASSVPPPSASKKEMGFSPCAEPREVELLHHWLHKGGIVLHFAGVDSITAAEALAGLIVAIPASERAQLAEGELHIADLIGCKLIDVSTHPPNEIGIIENVDRSAGPVPLLLVQGASGQVLIPFAETFLRNIDLENTRVEMSLPPGLLDLNQP